MIQTVKIYYTGSLKQGVKIIIPGKHNHRRLQTSPIKWIWYPWLLQRPKIALQSRGIGKCLRRFVSLFDCIVSYNITSCFTSKNQPCKPFTMLLVLWNKSTVPASNADNRFFLVLISPCIRVINIIAAVKSNKDFTSKIFVLRFSTNPHDKPLLIKAWRKRWQQFSILKIIFTWDWAKWSRGLLLSGEQNSAW